MSAYGAAAWPTRLAPIPQAHESAIIARVQSMRTRGGKRAEPLSYAESQAYLRRVDVALQRARIKPSVELTRRARRTRKAATAHGRVE